MKIKLFVVLFLIHFINYTQCNISSNENYIVRTTLINESQLDDPKFINQLKH